MKFTGTSTLFMSVAYLVTSLVSAQQQQEPPIVSITSPLSGTQYKAGSEAIISWTDPKMPTISQIVLAKGKSNALVPLLTIATNVNAADLKYIWKIPFEIDNGDDYAFELGTSPKLAFAGPFTIGGGVGGTPSATSSNTSAPAPAGNAAATPAAAPPSSSSTSSISQTSPHNASNSHTSAANKQNAGQAVVALGMVAAFASQFF